MCSYFVLYDDNFFTYLTVDNSNISTTVSSKKKAKINTTPVFSSIQSNVPTLASQERLKVVDQNQPIEIESDGELIIFQ